MSNPSQELLNEMRDSINQYAEQVKGMSIQQIMTSHFQPPNKLQIKGYETPLAKQLHDAWKQSERQWVQQYGSMAGYNNFVDYWSTSDPTNAGFKRAFSNDAYWSRIRAQFAGSYGTVKGQFGNWNLGKGK